MRKSRLLNSDCFSKNPGGNFFPLHNHSDSVFYFHTTFIESQLYALNSDFTKIHINIITLQRYILCFTKTNHRYKNTNITNVFAYSLF